MDVLEIEAYKSRVRGRIRKFLDDRGFVEVETPCLSKTAIPEHTIELFSTVRKGEFTKEENLYLLPSPELFLKKLVSECGHSVYEISRAFRNAEQIGRLHNSEFSMLEFYGVGMGTDDTIKLTASMLKSVFQDSVSGFGTDAIRIMTVSELMEESAGLSLAEMHDRRKLDSLSERLSLEMPEGEGFDDTFNRVFVHAAEPYLSTVGGLVFLRDYPEEIRCLAKRNGMVRDRFELYAGGVELANGYAEMTDADEIRELFAAEDAEMKSAGRNQAVDWGLADCRLPECSGVAVGLDRLCMLALGLGDIGGVLAFAQ